MFPPRYVFAVIMIAFAATARSEYREDIEYGRAGGYSLRLDANVPDGAGPFPAAIIVHGGAWVAGDRKRSVEPLFQPLSSHGFAWFSISYRLASDVPPGGFGSVLMLGSQIDDVRQAVAYVKGHASEYHVDANRIALIGESAGGQLASMAALQGAALQGAALQGAALQGAALQGAALQGAALQGAALQGAALQGAALKPGPDSTVRAVVALYSPSDLALLARTSTVIPDSLRQAVKNSALDAMLMAGLAEVSPVNWVRKDAPPFLLIHGTADRLVPLEQSKQMCEKMLAAGARCELYTVEGAGHGIRGWESSGLTAYKERLVAWLEKIMGGS